MRSALFATVLAVSSAFAAPRARAADIFSPVTTLAEIPAGIPYAVEQPPVLDAAVFRGKKVAILAAHGVQEPELKFPYDYLVARGADVEIVAPDWSEGRVLAVQYTRPTLWVEAQATFAEAAARRYDLIVVTGGAWNSQVARSDKTALALLRAHAAKGLPIAAICSGSQVLIDAGLARGATLTGSPTIRTDLVNAGATYVDAPAVVSGGLVTSRSPDDLPQFVEALGRTLTRDAD